MRIAIDVMGGDYAPDAILAGSIAALELLDGTDRLTLVGDAAVIRDALKEEGLTADPRIEVIGTTQVIDMAEPATTALRHKPDSSIAKWAWLGSRRCPSEQRADVIISAGNTGACVAAAQMMMRRLPGVHRPGIAVTIPTFHGPLVMCDVGANIVPKPMHLHQYGHMAYIYAQRVHGIENPRVGLLSIGGEEGKGTDLIKQTGKLMRADATLNYVGNLEGRDLFSGKADVVVTEGFTGNVVLKLAEGLAAGLFKTIAHEIFEQDPQLAMKFEPVVKQIYKKHDYHEFGGAPLLGAYGTCMICHGSSVARTIKAAVAASIRHVQHHVNEAIVEALAKSGTQAEASEEVA
jgi:phosphate acyltransferase